MARQSPSKSASKPKSTPKSKTVPKPIAEPKAASNPNSALPPPFEDAPSILHPWLDTLPKSPVYLTHIDPHPRSLKRTVFIVPVLLNLGFIALLVWRFSVTIPWYTSLLQQLWAQRASSFGAVYGDRGWWAFVKTELRHFVTLSIDYALLTIVAPWPWSFFCERPGNPTMWRVRCGFRDRELIVRTSRKWGAEDLLMGKKKGGESPFWKTRVWPYVQLEKMSKTGYLMMDKFWDLNFGAMTEGQRQLGKAFKEDDVNGKVFCWWSEEGDRTEGKWIMWDFRQELYMRKVSNAGDFADAEGSVEEGRRMFMRFRDKLEEMGKEDIFYRWVELIQFESSQPGGFTKERQEAAGQQVKQLFDDAGLDFEEFQKSVGIRDGKLVY
jgi:hypothetical protein